MKFTILAIALCLCFGCSASASNWEGEYSGECQASTQFECSLIMRDISKNRVDATLTVTMRNQSATVKCRLHGFFKEQGTVLVGGFGAALTNVQLTSSGSRVFLRGTDGKTQTCGVKLDGEFYIMGE